MGHGGGGAQPAGQARLALIDGNKAPKLACRTRTIIKGDAKCLSIAAASIVAKVFRDELMVELSRDFPGYGFERHKGYGTPEHQDAITRLGVTQHHRRSFKPVQLALGLPWTNRNGSRFVVRPLAVSAAALPVAASTNRTPWIRAFRHPRFRPPGPRPQEGRPLDAAEDLRLDDALRGPQERANGPRRRVLCRELLLPNPARRYADPDDPGEPGEGLALRHHRDGRLCHRRPRRYAIGYYVFEYIGQPILDIYHYSEKFDQARHMFADNAFWILVVKGLTPIPYKILTIAAGVSHVSLGTFIVASIIARAMRFYIVAALLYWFGPPIRDFIEKRLTLVTTLFVVLLIGGFIAVRYVV